MIYVTLFFLLLLFKLGKKFSDSRLQKIFYIIVLVWHTPLFLYQILPFELNIKPNYLLVYMIVESFLFGLFIALRKGVFSSIKSSNNSWTLYLISFVSIPIVWIDFFWIGGIDFAFNVESNREIYISNGRSVVGLFGYISTAFSMLLAMKYNFTIRIKDLVRIIPILIVIYMYLLTGNRQLLVFFVILLFFLYIAKKNPSSKDLFFKGFILIVSMSVFFFWYQFERQKFSSDDQLQMLYNISNMECVNHKICKDGSALFPAYIFQYFGNQYHGLSVVIDNDLNTPTLSYTLPIVYRRLSQIFNLTPHEDVVKNFNSQVEQLIDTYPNFWKTMFAQIYTDFGFFGIILWIVIITIYIFKLFKPKSVGTQNNIEFQVLALSFIIFAVMYIPFFEPVLFFIFIFYLIELFVLIFHKRNSE